MVNERVNFWLDNIKTEFISASEKFGGFNTPHEGYAVILEEVDELWDEIKKKERSPLDMQKEAVQVAAMALRFLIDCCDDDFPF